MIGIDSSGVLLSLLKQRQQFAGQALSCLLTQGQGLHQHRQLVFQPAPEPCGQGVLRADLPGARGQRPTQGQMWLAALFEEGAGWGVELRQAIEQLLQRVAHLPALLMQLTGFAAGAVFLAALQQFVPVFLAGGHAMGEQQGCFEACQIQQQLIADPASRTVGVVNTAVIHSHFKALGVAVAANRQLRTGQAQQRPGRVHVRTPNWCSFGA
ncbi:hypothetical protein D9M69_441200 [compost metagenome]